jgi:hypothetical protein
MPCRNFFQKKSIKKSILFSIFFGLYKFLLNLFEKKKYLKKVPKNTFEKKCDCWTFRRKPTLDPSGGRVNIMADGNFLSTYLEIGVDYEFDVKNNI